MKKMMAAISYFFICIVFVFMLPFFTTRGPKDLTEIGFGVLVAIYLGGGIALACLVGLKRRKIWPIVTTGVLLQITSFVSMQSILASQSRIQLFAMGIGLHILLFWGLVHFTRAREISVDVSPQQN